MRVDLPNQIVLRWDSDSNCSPLLSAGGIDTVWLQKPDERIASDCRAAGAEVLGADAIRLVGRDEDGAPPPGGLVALKAGQWPGARASARGADGSFSAGASQRAWVDADGYLVAWSKAFYPRRAPVLGYLPDSQAGIGKDQIVTYESLELALIDAWAAGGNYLLAPDAAYRNALGRGEAAATAAWSQLGRTARFLKENLSLFRQPPLSTITVVVEPEEACAEIAALLFRHSGSPELVSSRSVPAPNASRTPIVVAAGIGAPPAELGKLLLAHASGGATLIVDAGGGSAWWRAPGLKPERQFADRGFYTLGAGRVLVYKEAILDPGDFALDVLDLAASRRPVRLWDASAAIGMVSQAGAGAKPVLMVVNYGSSSRGEIMAHVRGIHNSATLMRPGEAPVKLRTCRRGENTEILLPGFKRLAVVVFG